MVWVRITEGTKLIVGAVYNHPQNSKFVNPNFFEDLQESVAFCEYRYPDFERLILMPGRGQKWNGETEMTTNTGTLS